MYFQLWGTIMKIVWTFLPGVNGEDFQIYKCELMKACGYNFLKFVVFVLWENKKIILTSCIPFTQIVQMLTFTFPLSFSL